MTQPWVAMSESWQDRHFAAFPVVKISSMVSVCHQMLCLVPDTWVMFGKFITFNTFTFKTHLFKIMASFISFHRIMIC